MKQTWKPAYPIAELTEHPDNPNRGDVELLRDSIEHHGFYGAVLVQKSSPSNLTPHEFSRLNQRKLTSAAHERLIRVVLVKLLPKRNGGVLDDFASVIRIRNKAHHVAQEPSLVLQKELHEGVVLV